ncbi:putative membrane protein [Thermostichus sp. MS-CIW-30]
MAGWGIGFRPYSRQRESVELRKTSPVMDENIVIMLKRIGRVCRPLLAIALALTLALAPIGAVWARSGGRIGGGSFRSPTFSAPRSIGPHYSAPVYPSYGGGFGFPLLVPFFWGGGGGGLLTLLLLVGAGSFLVQTLRSGIRSEEGDDSIGVRDPQVTVAQVKVGLLASARQLQKDMNALALEADTQSPEGLSQLLQEVTLGLMRYSDYWAYGHAQAEKLPLSRAESLFYQASLQERSKFSVESLSNRNNQIQQVSQAALQRSAAGIPDVGEYLLVTLLVAYRGNLGTLPVVNSTADLRQCLLQLASIPADRIVAIEVLWTPQLEGDTLSAEALLTEYPEMRLL